MATELLADAPDAVDPVTSSVYVPWKNGGTFDGTAKLNVKWPGPTFGNGIVYAETCAETETISTVVLTSHATFSPACTTFGEVETERIDVRKGIFVAAVAGRAAGVEPVAAGAAAVGAEDAAAVAVCVLDGTAVRAGIGLAPSRTGTTVASDDGVGVAVAFDSACAHPATLQTIARSEARTSDTRGARSGSVEPQTGGIPADRPPAFARDLTRCSPF